MAVWISQEAADLRAPVMRRGEEHGASGPQRLIGGLAVRHAQRHRVTDQVGVGGRLEDHRRLVSGRAAPADQQQPGAGESQHDAGAAVLAVQFGAQDVDPEIPRPRRVGDHQDVRDRHVRPERTQRLPCRCAQVILARPARRSGRLGPDAVMTALPGASRRSLCQFRQLMSVEWWCPFLMPAAASSHDFWQDFLRADDPVLTAPSYQVGYPARLADGRHLLLPIRVLPGDSTRAVASLITNQASFRVLDAIADVLTAQVAQFDAEMVIGLPTLGLPLAEGVARRLGHPRMVALSTSRKFWYDEDLSEPLSSITSPQQSKRVYLDPRSLALLAGRRILLVDDVLSTGTSISAVLRLLVKAGRPPTAIGVAMTQTQAWRAVLGRIDSRWPTVVRSAMSTPLLVPHEDGGWRPEAGTAVGGMDA